MCIIKHNGPACLSIVTYDKIAMIIQCSNHGGLCRQSQRTWLYRIRPSVTHEPFVPAPSLNELMVSDFSNCTVTPNQIRWRPFPQAPLPVNFLQGLSTICGAGRCLAVRLFSKLNKTFFGYFNQQNFFLQVIK